jgi:bifunctional aspartokinase / homoserine dehydrogenase 1
MPPVTLRLGLVGPGLVGSAFLSQLRTAGPALLQRGLDVRLVALANSKAVATSDAGLPPDPAILASAPPAAADQPPPASALAAFLKAGQVDDTPGNTATVLVDCTAGPAIPDALYLDLLGAGVSVVTPNKAFGAGPAPARGAALAAADGSGARFFGEATVGAGLPILSTLAAMVDSGDVPASVSGVFSGTLSFLFNCLEADPARPFSAIVADAKAAGYTEPDPRDDLSGTDVARKAVILARAAGVTGLEVGDVAVESLVPADLADPGLSASEFLAGLAAHDGSMAARAADAAARGCVLRYVARVDVGAGSATVGVGAVPASGHPLSGLRGAENAFAFISQRYPEGSALVVRGPGAGAQVTAAGVFADVLAVGRAAGARV